MKSDIRLIVVGGGTAGHINAGIALFDEFKKQESKARFLFVGTKRGMEKVLIPKAGYDINFISSRGLNRQHPLVFLYSLVLIPVSILQSIKILLCFKPDVIIGVGGFASGPFILSSRIFRTAVFLLEQNAVMGFTNKILINFARKVFSAFPLDKLYDTNKKKIVQLGNPIRTSIKSVSKKSMDDKLINEPKPFTVFIFGGSQGARAINRTIVSTISLFNSISGIKIIHQTGKSDLETVKAAYTDAKFEYQLSDYIYDIHKTYEDCDLVICRSGASSIFELIASKSPSLLIPLPTAANDHQLYNARFLSKRGCAELIEQKNLTPQRLYERIRHYMENRLELKAMYAALDELSSKTKQNAAELIVKEIKKNV